MTSLALTLSSDLYSTDQTTVSRGIGGFPARAFAWAEAGSADEDGWRAGWIGSISGAAEADLGYALILPSAL